MSCISLLNKYVYVYVICICTWKCTCLIYIYISWRSEDSWEMFTVVTAMDYSWQKSSVNGNIGSSVCLEMGGGLKKCHGFHVEHDGKSSKLGGTHFQTHLSYQVV